MIQHHLSDELLLDYAAGTMSLAWRIGVACHIDVCKECHNRLNSLELIGGDILDNVSPIKTDINVEDVFKALENEPDTNVTNQPVKSDIKTPLEAFEYHTGKSISKIKWWPMGMGLRQSRVLQSGGYVSSAKATLRLLYVPAGGTVPAHGHKSLEYTLILQGGFHDSDIAYTKGDVQLTDAAAPHKPVAMKDQDCICLAVTETSLQFEGWLPRLVRPFLQI